MSWQTPTHSSQMKTVGPAISLRTSFWLLLQNEHRKTSSLFFFKGVPLYILLIEIGNSRLLHCIIRDGLLPISSEATSNFEFQTAQTLDWQGFHPLLEMTSSIIPYSFAWSAVMM